ncbi:MAG: hypothetical protein HC796_01140 [Synechococcaceae cyanobacterium RL_1_2]|nr:hypothetical protein [Synechococcaceae cyanobacterium RL_1_2]
MLEHLTQLYRQETGQVATNELLFDLQWQAQPLSSNVNRGPGQWLILGDRGDLGITIAKNLEAQHHHCFIIPFESEDDTVYDLDLRLGQIVQNDQLPFHGVIFARGWGETLGDDSPNLDWQQQLRPDFSILIYLVKKLYQFLGQSPKLWLVTQQAKAIAGHGIRINLNHAPLWGLGLTVAVEYADLWGGLIDLDLTGSVAEAAAQICQEILQTPETTQVAYRSGTRYLPHLQRSPGAPSPPIARS